ncbi:MAG: cation:proton antiporter [Acidiferrobacterales bacterium]
MHEYRIIILAALLMLGFGLFSRLAERSPITGPMVFVAIGIGTGPLGLGLIEIELDTRLVRVIAEVTLVLILFVDACSIRLRAAIREQDIPFRLLLIALPLTILAGALVALPIFDSMGIWAIATLACVLCPTDAALGQPVVKSKEVPERTRNAINVESGLNDGLALPPLLVFLGGLSAMVTAQGGAAYWVGFGLQQLILGPLVGAFVGWFGGALVDKASRAGWMNPTFQRLASASLALLAYALAEAVHGNGFIAAFCGGLLLGTRTQVVRQRIHEFGEAEGQQLSLFVFLLFGLVLVPEAASHWDGKSWLYAVLSLTVIRMIPVAISLIGARVDWRTVGFIGWFGPRGIASVLYLLLVISVVGMSGHERMLAWYKRGSTRDPVR